jgi:hypothetical protein
MLRCHFLKIKNNNKPIIISSSSSTCISFSRFISFASSFSQQQQYTKHSNPHTTNPEAPDPNDDKKKPKRRYLTGFEHDPTYGPEAKRKEMLNRGIKLPPSGNARKAFYAQDSFEQQEQTKTAASPTVKRQDSRFTRKIKDFREMEDDDPYRELFGEKRSFVRTKVGAWRNQFEKENESVELPYERSGFLTRSAPNWFVRWMVGLRENQGLDFIYLFGAFGTVMICVALWVNATVVPFGREKDATQLK